MVRENMKMSRSIGIFLLALGCIMVIAAACLVVYNHREGEHAGKASEEALKEIYAIIPNNADDTAESMIEELLQSPPVFQELNSFWIEDFEYIGYLSIPNIDLALPVMSDWDYDRLRVAPCRQFGSTISDLVIAAHNYVAHFGKLSSLSTGDTVLFTDMDGNSFAYTITSIELLNSTDVDKIQYSGHNLVLYTCTYGGRQRVAVFCDLNDR